MDLKLAAYAAATLSLSFAIAAAKWYAAPLLRARCRARALEPLLWIHALRYIALQFFSATAAGFDVPDDVRDRIAYGDVLSAGLAFAALVALHRRAAIGIALAWVFSVVGIIDLVDAMAGGIQANLFDRAAGVTWLILTFYVPILWVSHVLIIWQLVSRRGEPLSPLETAGGIPLPTEPDTAPDGRVKERD
jgi:hypothetical protein